MLRLESLTHYDNRFDKARLLAYETVDMLVQNPDGSRRKTEF